MTKKQARREAIAEAMGLDPRDRDGRIIGNREIGFTLAERGNRRGSITWLARALKDAATDRAWIGGDPEAFMLAARRMARIANERSARYTCPLK